MLNFDVTGTVCGFFGVGGGGGYRAGGYALYFVCCAFSDATNAIVLNYIALRGLI